MLQLRISSARLPGDTELELVMRGFKLFCFICGCVYVWGIVGVLRAREGPL